MMTADVCVVGGPAGATIAQQLAGLGVSVCVIDKGGVAPGQVGVSLPPSLLPILDHLGIRGPVEAAACLRPRGTLVRWGASTEPVYKPYPEPGLTVDRIKFDAVLLAAAQDAGATVIAPALASRPVAEDDGMWHIAYRRRHASGGVHCRYLVDAAGRNAVLRTPRGRSLPATFAIHGHWRDVPIKGPEVRVDACEGHWAWAAPLPDGSCLTAVFLARCDMPGGGRQNLETTYRRLLAQSPLIRFCLDGKMLGPVKACEATASAATAVCGPRYIKVGEAALCIDPLSSQGVQRAMVGALQAAAVINTMLHVPEHADLASQFYQDRQREAAESDRSSSAAYYREQAEACPTEFWQDRAGRRETVRSGEPTIRPNGPSPERRLRLSHRAVQSTTGVLEGQLIVPRPALHHPNLGGPVAFLAGYPICDLLHQLRPGATVAAIASVWRQQVGTPRMAYILSWLWSHGILVDADT
jgi:flavin-dependent dehydrogenase